MLLLMDPGDILASSIVREGNIVSWHMFEMF